MKSLEDKCKNTSNMEQSYSRGPFRVVELPLVEHTSACHHLLFLLGYEGVIFLGLKGETRNL